MHGDRPSPSGAKGAVAAIAITVFAVVCCAGLPLLAAAAGSVALGSAIGAGSGIAATVTLVAVVIVRVKRRRACRAPLEPDAALAQPEQTADAGTAPLIGKREWARATTHGDKH